MESKPVAKKNYYAGLFMVALATLMYEIVLTRIFSVTMWYHFAFMAVSIAMFGMTAGATFVYVYPGVFRQDRTQYHLALSALLFSLSTVFSFLTQLIIPFVDPTAAAFSLATLWNWLVTYFVISIPFMFSGICVCLALTRFPQQLGKLYAADLVGAGVGCALLLFVIEATDGPTTVVVAAFVAGLASVFFAVSGPARLLAKAALLCCVVLALFICINTVLIRSGHTPLLRLLWVKGQLEPPGLFEKWNSFSRIRVSGDPDVPSRPFGWGLSKKCPKNVEIKQLWLNIDAHSATVLTRFDGALGPLDFLNYDVSNIAFSLRSDADVLVIGAGGGRDVLAALVSGEKSVLAVEMNQDIVAVVNGRYGDFTGHLDRHPKVSFVVDEARSYVARLKNKFDIIQISLIDTWAATAAGAYVLSESSLYTVEAWDAFLAHLKPEGVLAVSRGSRSEVYRVASLAATSLKRLGITNPDKHIIMVQSWPIGSILVSKSPFADSDIDRIEEISRARDFTVVFSPRDSTDDLYSAIASGTNPKSLMEEWDLPINISPPTDDNPFFFHTLRLSHLFTRWSPGKYVESHWNAAALEVLTVLLFVVVVLSGLFIILPLKLKAQGNNERNALPLVIFFASIGLGFMLIEISQLQRFNIFLGHPTYSLSVVLCSLLLSSGLGSFLTSRLETERSSKPILAMLLVAIGAMACFGALTPSAIKAYEASATSIRVGVAIAMVFPLGVCMGMPFPLGMRMAASRFPQLAPWFWGINGATSVCASVLALAIALFGGISMTFWTGVACYGVSFLALLGCNAARADCSGRQPFQESTRGAGG